VGSAHHGARMHRATTIVIRAAPPFAPEGLSELLGHRRRMDRLLGELDVLCRAVEDTPVGQDLQATTSLVDHLACHLRASDRQLEGLLGRVGRPVEER
jgi:hypothetical protein